MKASDGELATRSGARLKQRRLPRHLLYVTVIGFAYSSGNAFFETYYRPSVLLLFGWVVFLLLNGYRSSVTSRAEQWGLILLLTLSSSLWVTELLVSESEFSSLAAVFLILAAAYLAALSVDLGDFSRAYVNTVTLGAALSLAAFLLSFAVPTMVELFPLRRVTDSFEYHDAFFHVFLVSNQAGTEGLVFHRNNGFAWEPGAYQAFLNLALLMLLGFPKARGYGIRSKWKLMVLVVAVASTLSLTGYLVTALILVAHRSTLADLLYPEADGPERSLSLWIFALLAIGVSFAAVVVTGGSLSEKLTSGDSTPMNHLLQRTSLDVLQYVDVSPRLLWGAGFNWWLQEDLRIWNSIIHSTVALGLIFSSLLIYLYWRYSCLFVKPLIVFLSLMASFSVENLFWRPLFLYLGFAAVIQCMPRPNEKARREEASACVS